MRSGASRLVVISCVLSGAAGCFDDPEVGQHPCEQCLACETCVDQGNGELVCVVNEVAIQVAE